MKRGRLETEFSSFLSCNCSSFAAFLANKKGLSRVVVYLLFAAEKNKEGARASSSCFYNRGRGRERGKKEKSPTRRYFTFLSSSLSLFSLSQLARSLFRLSLLCMDLRVDNGGAEPPPPPPQAASGAEGTAWAPANMRRANNPAPPPSSQLNSSGLFSSAFAGSANRESRRATGSTSMAASESKRIASSADDKRLAPIFSGDVDLDDGGIVNGNGKGSNVSSSSSSKRKKKRRSRKKRSPWLSAPMILGSEVASNIA